MLRCTADRSGPLRRLAGCAALLALAMLAGPQALAGEFKLAVAANFTDAASELVEHFEQDTGHSVKTSFGSTGALYAQIDHGAPFDVFLAADRQRPERGEEESLAVAGSRFTYARGRLALWSRSSEAFDDGRAYLQQGAFEHLAIANPAVAPYGLAAEQVLEHLELWEKMQPKLIRGGNIGQTFQFVATGNAKAGFVALSQVRAWNKSRGSLWIVPEALHEPIIQQAVLLDHGENNKAARAFLDFLKSEPARRVITDYGYGLD